MLPLNIKTDNSLLYSMIKVPELVKKAKENNLKALTITDDNMYGTVDFYLECKKNGIKPIVGLEINLEYKFILYCQTYNGYKNLIKISTLISEGNISFDYISKHSTDLICIVPYESRNIYNELKKMFSYIFVGYKDDIEKSKIKSNNTVYLNEILCLNKEDERYLRALHAIKDGVTIKEIKPKKDVSLFPFPPFNDNNQKIIDLCNLELPFHQDLMPKIDNSYNILKEKCIEGIKNKFGLSAPKVYQERLKHELSIINKMGFCDYFLIVSDYVNYAKNNNILVGPGRGSAAGSLVSYLLNITTIDPLKYDLLFERFLNPDRVTMPDIDVDFEDRYTSKVIDYCALKYGEKKVVPIITFGTLGPRQAIRDAGRALNISLKRVDILSKMINPSLSLSENLKTKKLNDFINTNSDLKFIYQVALKLEGLKRHTSVHAAGVVMSKIDLDEVIPLDKSHDFYTTAYSMNHLEEIGLLKMDFLSLKNLSLISDILKDISISFDDIPNNDSKALNIFKDANTVGIFQFESDGMINFLKKFKPNTFDDVVASIALFRPGPMHNIDSYIRRKQGVEKVTYPHRSLESVLKPTYGIIIYQEQIMQIVVTMAGFSYAQADNLRRAMSKKKEDVLLKEKERFISQSIKRGYKESTSKEVYDLILRFASYGFNKSHSVAYAMISYRMAYLKAHYPVIFMKNLFSSALNSEAKTKTYLYECRKNGVNVLRPSINDSSYDYITVQNSIVFPFVAIKGISTVVSKQIVTEREKGNFLSIFDFVKRCFNVLNEDVIRSLILAGCFDKLEYNRKTLIDNLDVIMNYGQVGSLLEDDLTPELDIKKEYTKQECMMHELEVFGFYISSHPVSNYRKNYCAIEIKEVGNYFNRVIDVVICIDRIKIIDTKKKEKMMFITGTDEIGSLDIVLFPRVYNIYSNVYEGDILLINGKVEKRFGEVQLIANKITKLGTIRND